ncbi:hypothetical protein BC833DRAFT_624553 [Globomyces pollinis-pini]|nr:hypothetical protein BC833DRAFT_624553 [Globomyces pollinis-pini]
MTKEECEEPNQRPDPVCSVSGMKRLDYYLESIPELSIARKFLESNPYFIDHQHHTLFIPKDRSYNTLQSLNTNNPLEMVQFFIASHIVKGILQFDFQYPICVQTESKQLLDITINKLQFKVNKSRVLDIVKCENVTIVIVKNLLFPLRSKYPEH